MNRLILIVLTLAFTRIEAATVTFGMPRVENDNGAYSVRLDNCAEVAVSAHLSLPVELKYIRLVDREDPPDLRVAPGPAVPLALLGSDVVNDRPTALEPDRSPLSAASVKALPGRSLVTVELVETRSGRFARLTIFPVTVDPNGTLRHYQSLTIYRGDNPVAENDLLPSIPFDPGFDRQTERALNAGTTPAYLILTNSTLAAEAQRLAAYKSSIGLTAEVFDIAAVLATYPGRDDAERVREYLKDFHSDGGQYVLFIGDETVLPLRYAYAATATAPPDLHNLQICDLYFADLTGEWDFDNDNVWGEPYTDRPDWTPELLVGRLPFHSPAQVAAYTDKLIAYETLDGTDRSYLGRVFFFSSDEMRDYRGEGQHALIAAAFPATFAIDTASGVEAPTGDNPAPTSGSAADMIAVLSEGYGIVNILAHGRPDAFGVRTAGYNEWPKSYMITEPPIGTNARLDSLAPNNRVGLYYSLACDNGGFDQDAPPFVYTNPNLVTSALAQPHSGAVAFVAYSRWGWVGMSHFLQRAFFDSLFAHPERPASEAMARSKLAFPYYKDLAYGQNFYGDPSLRIFTGIPDSLWIAIDLTADGPIAVLHTNHGLAESCTVIVSIDSGRVASAVTDNAGRAVLQYDFAYGRSYTIAASLPGYNVARTIYTPSLTTDTDNPEETLLPNRFALSQNFPNPFNPTTTISFDLPRQSHVRIEIFDITGRQVGTLIDKLLSAGRYNLAWDSHAGAGGRVASGVYVYRMTAGDFVQTRKMVLLR